MSVTDPAHLANIWLRVRSMFVRMSDIVGAIPALAVLTQLRPPRQREIASCIALVETIVRKLLLIEAAQIQRTEGVNVQTSRLLRLEHIAPSPKNWSAALCAASSAEAAAKAECATGAARNLPAFDITQPETWRVRFKLGAPRDPLACSESKAPRIRALWGPSPTPPQPAPKPERRTVPAPLRLAQRFEALRRAIADPLPLARKLARTLPRLCRRCPAAAERYASDTARPHRTDEGDPRLIIDAMVLALAEAPSFVNSS